ncbi:hypothetical protein Q760_11345 [Cellulomonas cellasea DSM 20118]|uniref:Ribbon-helix-helix protein CopG domain-containing protein n=1 Tax=Cellulomonas cellasea DSM 20118 TaxID=1408250 RepID=A0A0A0B7H0_9CELL|nr:hypothetical protein Q760_11345 [Cellulomonas cellasea DSM 20118]
MRVRASTRDELNALSAERGVPVEAVIRDGIALLRREQWRRQAEIDARAAAADPQDRAEVASILSDLLG